MKKIYLPFPFYNVRLRRVMRTFLIACGIAGSLTASADIPFRNHRYSSFKAVPVSNQNIVFFGNSITNMNEWWECFGSNPLIVNRGNSGAVTQELIDNVESLIAGHPAKVFIGIGTNDLGTHGIDSPSMVAGKIRTIIDRFQAESPRTQIYVQSILPSNVGIRTDEKLRATNALLKRHCDETGATYVNLYDSMGGVPKGEISYDRLHITAKGYKIWTDIIAPMVGTPASYPAEFEENASGLRGSLGMRSTYWSAEEVGENDVLFIGDEMVHGGEWHELLNSSNVKSRGTQWGYGGLRLSQWEKAMEAIFATNPERKKTPRMVILNMGLIETNGTNDFDSIAREYQKVIEKVRSYAPAEKTKLVITSQLPRLNAQHNADRVVPMNRKLKLLAAGNGAEYVDLYTPLVTESGAANPDMIKNDYVYAKGYNKIAQALAPVVGDGAHAMSDAAFDRHYAMIEARIALGNEVEKVKKELSRTKDYEVRKQIKRALNSAYKLLQQDAPSVSALAKQTTALAALTTTK